jgi:DNA-binding IclR family transcriptional regulator
VLQTERLTRGEWASVRQVDEDLPEAHLVKSGARALEVLEYLALCQRPVRAIDIGAALKLPKSSTNVLLKTLVETGYLTFDFRAKTYFPSLRVLNLGSWLRPDLHGAPRFFDLMQELSRATGGSCAVSVQNGCFMQFVSIYRAGGYLPPGRVEGGRIPIIGAACGGALLTVKSGDEVDSIVAASLGQRCTPQYRSVLSQVRMQAAKFRRQGYAITYGGIDPKIASIAMVLPKLLGNVPMILGCGGESLFAWRDREPELAGLMRGIVRAHLSAV